MKKLFKLTTVFLLIVMLVNMLAACNNIQELPTDTTADITTTEDTNAKKTIIAAGGKTEYKIIRPDDPKPEEDFIDAFLKIKYSIDEKGNCSAELGDDFKRPTESYNSQTYEILVGNTDYDETKEVMNTIGYYDYAIKEVGNKIVIAAHTKGQLIAACEYFAENLLAKSEGNELVYLGDYLYESTTEQFFDNDNKFEDYVIIYPSNNQNKEDAEKLSKFIYSNYKTEIKVYSDTRAAAEKEILIGSTNRTESIKYLSSYGLDNITQLIKLENKKVVLLGKSEYSTECSVLTFINLITNKKYSNMINIPKTTNIQSAAFPATDTNELANYANLRIMSYNILSEEWNDKLPLTNRDNYVAATILYYSPDVVGLQELSVKWYNTLPNLISSDYTMVNMKNSKNQSNYTGMAYNKNKVRLLENGTDLFSAGNSTRLRLVSWGYFEKLETGERFFVMNTHWCIEKENRLIESKEMAQIYKDYKAKYNCPIITTGDYNANQDAEEYLYYVQHTGLKSAGLTAQVKNRQFKSYHTVGIAPNNDYTKAIDHIFYSDDIDCLYYNILIDQIVLDSSDHCPIYADFNLK